MTTPLQFRDLFLGALNPKYRTEDAEKLIYLPTDDLLRAPENARSAKDFIAKLRKSMLTISPVALYKTGLKTQANPIPKDKINQILKSPGSDPLSPLTIVIIPGIFSEFIDTKVFEEVFSQKTSAFRSLWRERLKIRAKSQPNSDELSDMQYNLQTLSYTNKTINDLLAVSSLDSQDGTALINLVIFKTARLSLETFGDTEQKAAVFLRRLRKFYSIIGMPQNIAFLGYSRGTCVGLEMLSQANKTKDHWLSNFRAMISMGGVTYGSELADEALNARRLSPAPPPAKQLDALEELSNKLIEKPGTGKLADARAVIHNAAEWIKFLRVAIETLSDSDNDKKNKSPITNLSITRLGEGVDRYFKEKTDQLTLMQGLDMQSGLNLFLALYRDSFELDQPIKKYNENIRRFKQVSKEIITGVRQLSTSERLSWWATHTVPTKAIRYYSITGTMVDSSNGPLGAMLMGNTAAYNPISIDDMVLHKNYGDFKRASGIALNDSQVAIHKVRFWPEISNFLNPEQDKLETTFLGVLGTHHWGMAFRMVGDMKKHAAIQYNPFPRKALITALAASVVLDMRLTPAS